MQRFILMENIARFRTWLAEEHDEFDRRVVRELLAKALRDFAIFQAESAGLIAEIDVSQSQEQKTMFRNSFETSGDPYLLLDPRKGLHIVDINGAYGEATMTSSAKVAGNRLFDIFPDNPQDPKADGVSNLFTSLSRVVETGKLDNAMMYAMLTAYLSPNIGSR